MLRDLHEPINEQKYIVNHFRRGYLSYPSSDQTRPGQGLTLLLIIINRTKSTPHHLSGETRDRAFDKDKWQFSRHTLLLAALPVVLKPWHPVLLSVRLYCTINYNTIYIIAIVIK